MRNKDNRVISCKLCQELVPASGMPSHLYWKHGRMKSEEYVQKFGEFRRKHLLLLERETKSGVVCEICKKSMVSHKHLLHHIRSDHGAKWQDYFIKYFLKGVHPVCKCGCGQKVKLIRQGTNEKGHKAYARTYIQGHDTRLRQVGYRTNSQEQRETMRLAAIKRMKEGKGVFFENGTSASETEVKEFIKQYTGAIVENDKKLLSGLEVDILIPEKNLAIEFNGTHFHSDLFKDRKYHLSKTSELKAKGYSTIHIWESDWYEKREIVKSILKSKLGVTGFHIYARQTEIREVGKEQTNLFLSENHLQGPVVDKVRVGLFYNDELVSLMTFSSLRKAVGMKAKDGSYELVRFCTKLNTTVTGGASKLLKFFIKKYNPNSIISYANRDWSNGNLYEKLGMTFKGFTPPGYFYVKSKRKYSRFQFQKHKLIEQGSDASKTEYEIMTERGYVRVWDCGNLKYEWRRNS